MADPLFPERSPRFDLPLLWVGQAQKEGCVNELAARIDALLHLAIESELAAPPAEPTDGKSWLVAAAASGEWAGKSGQIASRQAGNWLFAKPVPGMRLLNRSTGQDVRYLSSWTSAARPAAPSGGTTVDAEARTAIAAITACLAAAGLIPAA